MPEVVRWLAALELDAVVVVEAPAGVEAPEGVGQAFAHVAEEEPGVGEVVEDAAEDQAQGVRRGVGAPAPHGSGQFGMPGEYVRRIDAVGWVQVQRDVHAFGHGPYPAQR